MNRKICFLLIVPLSCTLAVAQGELCINELMQSNVDFMMVNHDFPDSWAELYNGSNKSIQIEKYRIGTSNVFSEAFQLSTSELGIEQGVNIILYSDGTRKKVGKVK